MTVLQSLAVVLRAPRPFLVAVVGTVAVSVGAAAAMFTVVHAFLLSALPYDDPERLVMVWRTPLAAQGPAERERIPLSPGTFTDLAETSRSLGTVAGLISDWATVTGAGDAQRVHLIAVVGDLFALTGTRPVLGRTLAAEDGRPDAAPVVVVGHGFWQRQLGGDPEVLGRRLKVGAREREIVGVLPDDFRLVESLAASDSRLAKPVDLWTPHHLGDAAHQRGFQYLYAVGRLAPGADLAATRQEIDAHARAAAARHPETDGGYGLAVVPLHEEIFGHLRAALLTLLTATGLVVLVACANLATLHLARGTMGHRDAAVRMALGADRLRLARESLLGSLLLALLGGLLALGVAYAATRTLTVLRPLDVFHSYPPRMGAAVVAFTLLVAALAGLLFGGLSAAWSSRGELAPGLGERGTRVTRRSRWAFALLVVVQIALATTLLIGTGLAVRTYAGLLRADTGIDSEGVLTFDLHLPRSQYGDVGRKAAFFRELNDRIGALPGVESVGLHYALPFSGVDPSNGFTIVGRPAREGESLSANLGLVDEGYFETLGIPLLGGRLFHASDSQEAPAVAIVDRRMTERYFGGRDPLGRQITIAGDEPLTIVGVVGAVQQDALESPERPYVYLPLQQRSYMFTSVAVRTGLEDPFVLADSLRAVLRDLDPSVPISNLSTLETAYRQAIAPQRFSLLLIGLLAAIALFLALVGIYGVTSFLARQRRREIGIRMALGADPKRVFRLFVRQGLAWSLAGTVLGLFLALTAERVLSSLVYGLDTLDALVLSVVPLLILLAAFLAYSLPARTWSRLPPTSVLHSA